METFFSILIFITVYLLIGLVNVFLVEWFVFNERNISLYEYRVKIWMILMLGYPCFYLIFIYLIFKTLLGVGENED